MLDLVFVSDSSEISIIRHTPVANPEVKYHPTLEINYFHHPFRRASTLTQTLKKFYFNSTNHNKLHLQLSEFDCVSELSGCGNDLNQCTMKFYRILHNCFVACVPKALPHSNRRPPCNTNILFKIKKQEK